MTGGPLGSRAGPAGGGVLAGPDAATGAAGGAGSPGAGGAVPPRWRRLHFAAAAAASLTASAAGIAFPDPALTTQLAVTAAAVALLGLPHGAVDHLYGRTRLAPRFGPAWPAVFAAGYLGLAALVVALWLVVPAVALIGFLALSARHFGIEDAAFAPAAPRTGRSPPLSGAVVPPAPRIRAAAEAWARGALPVLLPVALHPAETGRLFAWLLPGTAPAGVAALLTAGQPAALALALALVLGVCAVAVVRRRPAVAAEVALLAAAFAVLPPLLGFALYFCLWHAPRHSLRVIADHHPGRLARGLARFARSAAALTAATTAAAAFAWWLLAPAGGPGPAATQVLFIGLAALTLPHAVLHGGGPHQQPVAR
jgi:Brp/Blh family beta-carotene 15,15'-monooxygenase